MSGDHATSYLIFVHVDPIPEDADIVLGEKTIKAVAEVVFPDHLITLTAAWVSDFQVVSMSDLDALPEM